MKRNLRGAFGLSLLAALVVSAMSVMSASAVEPGPTNHFTTSSTKTEYLVTETTGTPHQVKLSAYNNQVECHNPQYKVHHTSTTTFTTLTVTPVNDTSWNCTDSGGHTTVHFNGCHYQFTAKNSSATHATVHFICPTGKKAEVTASNGSVLKFGAQTPTSGGATYTNTNGHVTANITAEGIHVECHGLCVFLGTNRTDAKMTGAATIEGFNTDTGAKSHLTAT